MIDINQVQRDFDNGVMLCRETIRQVIELAGKQKESEHLLRWASRELLGALPEKRDWFNPDAEEVLREFASKNSSCG